MPVVIHAVNSLEALASVPEHYGIEIDVRFDHQTSTLYLAKRPVPYSDRGPALDDFMEVFLRRKGMLILNVKESETEMMAAGIVERFGLTSERYFFLDAPFPFIYHAHRRGVRQIAIRFSELEPIGQVELLSGSVDWVFIDTFTRLPVDASNVQTLRRFKTCLVCPSQHERRGEVQDYIGELQALGFRPDLVLTDLESAPDWEQFEREV